MQINNGRQTSEAEECFGQALAIARCQQAKSLELRAAMSLSRLWKQRCSSATTLIMKWLEFSGQELSKRPDMICQSGGHAGCSVAPLGLDQSRGVWLLVRQRQTQTHVRPGEVVESLKVDHAPPHLGPILTEAPALAHQRRQRLPQGDSSWQLALSLSVALVARSASSGELPKIA